MATRSKSKSADRVDHLEAEHAAGDCAVTAQDLNDIIDRTVDRTIESVEATQGTAIREMQHKFSEMNNQIADIAGQVASVLDVRRQHYDEESLLSMVSETVINTLQPILNHMQTLATQVDTLARPTASQDSVLTQVTLASSADLPASTTSGASTIRTPPTYAEVTHAPSNEAAAAANSSSKSDKYCKLPPFDGTEKWKVYFNRFEAVKRSCQ